MSVARRVLADVFGFEAFRPCQEAVIEALLGGRNVLTVMPTGSGKSLCFQVPALVGDGLTVVVSPLVALMRDQVAALELAGVAADGIHSGNERAGNVAAWRRAASGETRLLYMAPERLMTERMLAALSRLPVALFAIDEAHCISQWGPAFRPEYAELCRLRERFPGVPIAALTATADEVTREDIAERLFGGEVEQFVLGFDRPNITLAVQMKRDWKRQLQGFIARHEGESGIVYCLSRKKTEETAALLAASGVRALPYHAGMDTEATPSLDLEQPALDGAVAQSCGLCAEVQLDGERVRSVMVCRHALEARARAFGGRWLPPLHQRAVVPEGCVGARRDASDRAAVERQAVRCDCHRGLSTIARDQRVAEHQLRRSAASEIARASCLTRTTEPRFRLKAHRSRCPPRPLR